MRYFTICLAVFMLCGCMEKHDDGYLCRFLYFPTSDNENCFWVEVKENQTMKVTFGAMTWSCHHSITKGKFPKEGIDWENIKEEDSLIIETATFNHLEVLASEVRKNESVNQFLEGVSYDGMGIVLFTKDKHYYIELSIYKEKATKKLIYKLKEISPIPLRCSVGSVLQTYFAI